MTNEEIKTYLEYTKVLLAINGIKDKEVNEALDHAIYTFDDKVYPTPVAVKDLEKLLNSNNKFLNLWSDLIAISSIKRVESKKVDSVDNSLLQIKDPDLREKATAEINKRRKNGDRVNIEILKNILDRLTD